MAAAFALLSAPSALAQQEPRSAEVKTLNADVDRLSREGRFDEAIPLAERALSIQKRVSGPDHPEVLKAINNLALLYKAAGDYVSAEALFERVLEITIEALGPGDPAVATTVNNLGMLYWQQGDRARAAKFLEKALEIWERSLGPDHPKVAVSLGNVASLYRMTGDLERAEPLYERALAIWDQSSDPAHDQLVETLRQLGAIRQGNGDYARAESLLKRALALDEKAYGASHTATAVALNGLASLYFEWGDDARARSLLERVLAIVEGALGPDHPAVASALSNLASFQVAIGDYASAEGLYERALAIRTEVLGADHLLVAASLENLASLYRVQGDVARSRPICERALAIRVKILGSGHLEVARTTSDLGAILWASGDFAGAEPLFERAVLIREKALGPKHSLVATSVDNLASVYRVRGNDAKAMSLYQAAFTIREQLFEPEHPAIVQSLRNLGLMYWKTGDWKQAETHLARAAENEERQIALLLSSPFEGRARGFMQALSDTTHLILSFQGKRPDSQSATRLAFTTALRRKGRELDVVAGESAAFQRRLDEEQRAVLDRLLALRSELGRLIVREVDPTRSEARRAKMEKLRREVGDLENAAAMGGGATRSRAASIQIEELQSSIPADAALVELIEYRHLDPTQISTDRARGTAHLAAFVLRSSGEPRWVPLGEAEAINASVRAFWQVLTDADVSPKKLRKRSRDLYDRLAAPLDPHLQGIQTVWVAPDGAVALVPFGALVGPDDRHWIERIEFTYLTSGRDLLLSKGVHLSQTPPLVVVAPDYDAEPPAAVGAAREAHERRSPEIAALRFPPIALSQTGALDVGRLLGVTPLAGAHASDAALQAARAPRVLHVALDGFFLPDQASDQGVRWGTILGVDSRERPPVTENPLFRSGFALAGANRQASDAGRGILTALEIAGLDLWGTQLVGLATRGIESQEAAVGHSVYALRRAVMLAGAEAQFANLWTTDFRAATDLTTAYYERLLAGEGRSQALRSVQLEMLRSENRSHPFYWAGFIPIGARGPIVWEDARDAGEEIPGSP
jgi:tetratricopeptide (TPR) repeat protein/CHAT domain-containing protein